MDEQIATIPDWLLGVIALFILAMSLITYSIHAYLLARLFKKAGVETWKAWIPLYQYKPLLEMGGQKGFWAFFIIVPGISVAASVFIYVAMYNIGLSMGKKAWFVLLGIVIPIVWVGWLGLDNSKWPGKNTTVTTTNGTK